MQAAAVVRGPRRDSYARAKLYPDAQREYQVAASLVPEKLAAMRSAIAAKRASTLSASGRPLEALRVYLDLNQVDKSAEQLKILLDKEPDNPTYNNDLGYIWADHDMNLEEAEKLIRKALDEDRKRRKKEKTEEDNVVA